MVHWKCNEGFAPLFQSVWVRRLLTGMIFANILTCTSVDDDTRE